MLYSLRYIRKMGITTILTATLTNAGIVVDNIYSLFLFLTTNTWKPRIFVHPTSIILNTIIYNIYLTSWKFYPKNNLTNTSFTAISPNIIGNIIRLYKINENFTIFWASLPLLSERRFATLGNITAPNELTTVSSIPINFCPCS